MSLLFALALCVSPSRAGVVMPVENGVAPAGPSAPVVPVVPGNTMTGSSLGSVSLDLRSAFPLLPAPVPGLGGPRLNFVGDQSAAASVQPQSSAASPTATTPTPARSRAVRAADQKPTLPGKTSSGASVPAVFRDRDSAKTPENNSSVLLGRGADARPLVETSSLEHALPESAAGAGRRFFDQGRDAGFGTLENPSSAGSRSEDVAGLGRPDASFGPGATSGLSRGFSGSGSPEGHAGRERLSSDDASGPGGEVLRDAVGAPPAPGAAAGAGAVSFFRSASPNGEALASVNGPASSPPGAPSPLALDLSRSGLVVRVRSALGSVLPAPAAEEVAARLPAAAASTALLERGGMLEAFSAVDAYAGAEPGSGLTASSFAQAREKNAIPSPRKTAVPSPSPWLALLAVPLLVAAARRLM